MQLAKVSDILIADDRQRTTFDPIPLADLSQKIQLRGLMHAPVMQELPDGKLKLIAGERRIKAISDMWMLGGTLRYNNTVIPEGFIPYVTLGQLSPLAAEEAELEENLAREPLTWQESAAAMSRLHKLRSAQAQAEGRIHTVADTAMETKGRSDGSYQESVRKDLIVSRHLHIPEVAKAKDANEAFKIIKKQEHQQKNIELAKAIGSTASTSMHEIHNVNCLHWMSVCEPGTFDVILTDPPYGMGADTFGDGGGGRLANNEHHYKDDYEGWKALMREWAPLSYRVAKDQAHAYVFCDIDNFHELKTLMQLAGWYVFRTPFICTKPGSGRVPLPSEGPRRQYETLLYAIKGHKNTTAIYSDVLVSYADKNLTHGAQKPVELYENLLLRSVRPGDKVLDCFGGSGTLIPAAHSHKCRATVLELSKEYFAMCHQRIIDLDKPVPVEDGAAMAKELQSLMGGV